MGLQHSSFRRWTRAPARKARGDKVSAYIGRFIPPGRRRPAADLMLAQCPLLSAKASQGALTTSIKGSAPASNGFGE
ncbi:hypothetical protein EVAR_95890_1 [Eumeta japonica]|uniref:Uncharacterized protein n=1 Tax=Eumeta variegata TaxID=151549 RepID=A0A4C2AFP1_EUMVA|nr:hypothetical protein EVAR_95890_1 [Eumeta japonica]